jgi:hypothetical protein
LRKNQNKYYVIFRKFKNSKIRKFKNSKIRHISNSFSYDKPAKLVCQGHCLKDDSFVQNKDKCLNTYVIKTM